MILGISYNEPGRKRYGSDREGHCRRRFPLAYWQLTVSLVAGTLLGMLQAFSQGRWVRTTILFGTIFGAGIPNFVIALLLALVFGVQWKLLPVVGLDSWTSYLLPVLSLAAYPTAVVTRLMCHACRQELQKEYVVLAKVKGLSMRRIAWTHVWEMRGDPLVLNYAGPAAGFLFDRKFCCGKYFYDPGAGKRICQFDCEPGLYADHGADDFYGSCGDRCEPGSGFCSAPGPGSADPGSYLKDV